MTDRYDIIVVGSSFATTFFLREALTHMPRTSHVLMLERGPSVTHAQRLHDRRMDDRREPWLDSWGNELYVNDAAIKKRWDVSAVVGGNSLVWSGCAPRMLPEDFELHSRHGVGADWPISYNDLEPHYLECEQILGVAGPSEGGPVERSGPYPFPPHLLSDPEKALKRAFADRFFELPSTRPTRSSPSPRPVCCGSGVCFLCPVDSKFTVLNGMRSVFDDPRVTLLTGANVLRAEIEANRATGVTYARDGREQTAKGDLIVLGASAMVNPYLLLRSGIEDQTVGAGLVEQAGVDVDIDLDGMDNFQGTSMITGHGYNFYTGAHRRDRAAALIETQSAPQLRDERGKWRQRMRIKFVFEDHRQAFNRVVVDPSDPTKPRAIFKERSPQTRSAIDRIDDWAKVFLAPLPVERYRIADYVHATEGHILGTAVMGDDPATSVVDRNLVHHRVRNLVVVGASAFPTSAPANPTLTLCALSMMSAKKLLGN